MADRESVHKWLSEASYRIVNDKHPARGIVERLVLERKAKWWGGDSNRVFALRPATPSADGKE